MKENLGANAHHHHQPCAHEQMKKWERRETAATTTLHIGFCFLPPPSLSIHCLYVCVCVCLTMRARLSFFFFFVCVLLAISITPLKYVEKKTRPSYCCSIFGASLCVDVDVTRFVEYYAMKTEQKHPTTLAPFSVIIKGLPYLLCAPVDTPFVCAVSSKAKRCALL
jgi:hypothetical protein